MHVAGIVFHRPERKVTCTADDRWLPEADPQARAHDGTSGPDNPADRSNVICRL